MSSDEKKRRQDDDLQSKSVLLHDLQVHRIELEMQNQQLREAQQQLEESRDRYADLYDYAPVGYLTLDETGGVLGINLTGAGMLGRERFNIVGQPFISLLAASSIHYFREHLRQVFAVPGNNTVEVRIKAKNGIDYFVRLESMVLTVGESRVCRTVMSDITEQRKLAAALQANRSALDVLLNTIPALVFYLDANLCFMNVSQAYSDFLGRSPEEIKGKSIHDLLAPDAAAELGRVCTSVLHTGMALYGFENGMADGSGAQISLSTTLAPYREPGGRIIGLVGVSIDISTIKNASNSNSELLIQNRKLTRNLFSAIEEERRHLARELHDELGQWLTAIQAEAEAITIFANNHAPKIHDSAFAISNSAKAVHQVVRGMLRNLRPSLLDELGLADSLRELQRQWRHSHPAVDFEMKLEAPLEGLGEELNVTIYRLVQEALNNIASYAQARKVAVDIFQETGEAGEDFLWLNIDDDGVGFDSKQGNMGLGLLGMRERVIAAGGIFYLDTAPGRGTHISAKLPLACTTERDQ